MVVAVVRWADGLVVAVVRGAELSALDGAGLVVRGVDFGADVVADGFVVVVVRGADGFVDVVDVVVRGVELSMLG